MADWQLTNAAVSLSSANHWLMKAARESGSRERWEELEVLRSRVADLRADVKQLERELEAA